MAPHPKPVLKQGSAGPDVKELQGWLNLMPPYFRDLITDGIYGPKTAAKVKEFQALMQIAPDAVVGPITWGKINTGLIELGIPGILPGSSPPMTIFDFTNNDRPGQGALWHESKAWDIHTLRNCIIRHNKSALDANTILSIFFEETAFANIAQATKSGKAGPGRGFGQMETRNTDKQPYFAWAGLPTDPPGTPESVRGEKVSVMMLADREESVRIHVGWFNWLTEVHGKDYEGILSAQVGNHVAYKPLFRRGGAAITAAFGTHSRLEMINALNLARAESPKKNGIPWPRFGKFWRFTIPDWSMFFRLSADGS